MPIPFVARAFGSTWRRTAYFCAPKTWTCATPETVEIPETQLSLEEARTMFPGAEIEIGQEIEFPKPTDVLGRIAAQTAKQVIFQKVREAERDNVFAEYSGRVGEVVNGIVKRQEMGDFVVDLGRAEALLPRKEQSRAEAYQTGDRVRVAIVRVAKAAKGPQVIVSRTDPANKIP